MKYELYQFKHGDKIWNFTSHRKDIKHKDITYKSVRGLSRDSIEDESIDKCEVELTFPQVVLKNSNDDNFISVFLNKIYFESVHLTILELEDNETLVLFKGRVTQPQFSDSEDTMKLICSTAESYLRRNILTRKYQRTCPNSIYDKFCGLKISDWSFQATVTAINALSVSFTVNPTQVIADDELLFQQIPVLDEFDQPILDDAGQPVFENGDPVMEIKTYEVSWLNRGVLFKDGLYTYITNHSAGMVSLYKEHFGLNVGDVVSFSPGCDQSHKTCHEKYANHIRYGGHPNMPRENPLETQLIK